jgi:hypothetical protein
MSAPMAGFGPMAWSPFPYGAVPSSGVASDKFVDLFNDQTVAGTKTWQVTAVAGTAETIAKFNTTEQPTNFLAAINALATDAAFSAALIGVAATSSSRRPLGIMGRGTDSGAVSVISFDAAGGTTVSALGAGTALTVRPLFSWSNNGTSQMAMSAAGGLSISGGTTPSLTLGAAGTAITQMRVYSQAIDPASVAANTTAEQTFTVTGLTTADKVFVNKPTNTAGLGIVNARVSAADTLAITFGNFTAAPIDAASETYTITAIRS